MERLIRGLNPCPSAFTNIDGKLLKIFEAHVLTEDEVLSENAVPGEIIFVDKKSFTIRCGNGALKILNLQLEGKKRMDTSAFLLGYSINVGKILS